MSATVRPSPRPASAPAGVPGTRLANRRPGGSLRQRANGVWEARLYLAPGKRQSVYGPTREAVAEKLAALQELQDLDRARGLAPAPAPNRSQPATDLPPRRSTPSRTPRRSRLTRAVLEERCTELLFTRAALAQLVPVVEELLQTPTPRTRDDLVLTLAAARGVLRDTAAETVRGLGTIVPATTREGTDHVAA